MSIFPFSHSLYRIATTPEHARVVTVSAEGSIKVWNERALLGECYGAVRSDSTFYPGQMDNQRNFFLEILFPNQDISLKAGNWMNRGQYFTVATATGEVIIVDLSAPNEKILSRVCSIIFRFKLFISR